MGETINIWDSDLIPATEDRLDVLWRSYSESKNEKVVSIPRLVEKNSDYLKKVYLAWVFELGEVRVEGKRVVEHLEISPGFSFWWMSLISQKLNYSASPHITTAIRLLAFDLWARDKNVDSITLTSDDKALAECIKQWCLEREILFFWRFMVSKKPSSTIGRKIYKCLPNMVKALAQITRRIWTCWPLRGVGLDSWMRSNGEISFFSYLFNLDQTGDWQGEFKSRFWTKLPDELSKNDCKTNWLHIYIADPSHPTAKHAKAKLEDFNKMGRGEQTHTSLESFLSWPVTLRALKDWFGILKFAKILEPVVSRVDAEGVHLWPLFKEEWYSSLSGDSSLSAILNFNLLKEAVGLLPKQRAGVYLYEQQAWELALIHCWRDEGHGLLVGAQHTSLLDWNLRNFHDPRNYERLDYNDLPMPDILAVNGPKAMETAIENGYPECRLFEVEALRYLYLEDFLKEKEVFQIKKNDGLRLLVLGDYLESNTRNQMDLLVRTLESFPIDIKIIVKPHPACMIHPEDYPEIDIKVSSNPLQDLLGRCDLAYSSPVTSAAVDAYCFGVPVITALDSDALNLSPLRNCADVCFVSTSEELSEALNSITSRDVGFYEKKEIFTLDSELPRWKKLLLESKTYV
jgi:surface carbohydrate biosynthesis protein (TIGR04326 family)